MKPTREDIAFALRAMQQTIDFFPSDPIALGVAHSCIEDMVSTREQLEWLTRTACRVMKRYSLPELRGIFCSRYAPADGLYTAAETPGFTLEESVSSAERTYHEMENRRTQAKLEEWKREAKLLGTVPQPEPLKLPPGANEMPKAKPLPEVREPRRPLREVEEEAIAQPRKPARSPEEQERLIAELEEKLKAKGVLAAATQESE
jgi:hypothetical protein